MIVMLSVHGNIWNSHSSELFLLIKQLTFTYASTDMSIHLRPGMLIGDLRGDRLGYFGNDRQVGLSDVFRLLQVEHRRSESLEVGGTWCFGLLE